MAQVRMVQLVQDIDISTVDGAILALDAVDNALERYQPAQRRTSVRFKTALNQRSRTSKLRQKT